MKVLPSLSSHSTIIAHRVRSSSGRPCETGAPTEPAGETEPASSDRQSGVLATILQEPLREPCNQMHAPVGAFPATSYREGVLWSYEYIPIRAGEFRPAFKKMASIFYPHFLAVVSTTTILSMLTPNLAAKITRLSIVGMAVP